IPQLWSQERDPVALSRLSPTLIPQPQSPEFGEIRERASPLPGEVVQPRRDPPPAPLLAVAAALISKDLAVFQKAESARRSENEHHPCPERSCSPNREVRTMKSVLFSRFFILLPWILIVIIMLDVDTRRPAPPLHTHLHVPTPRRYKRPGLPRATEQRNAGLAWLRQRHQHQRAQPGVLFFADDDNTYSLELFQMRTTRKVSVWPVGLVGGRRYERPLVENGKVVGWYTGWRADRPFAIDMAGFAVSLQVILSNPKAVFKRRGSQPGMQESDFLKQITTVEELEPKANNCTKVLVWHTRTEKVNLANEPKYHLDTVKIEV
uniref:Galactosylgalactosylxylosylprotein 3-beta-glucuronosyltransferase n=1 Tax=Spermophilus dauricus TaxID=99837 RepID=A0A8C9Q6Z7_SPEDA